MTQNYLDTTEIRNTIQEIHSLLPTPISLGDPTFKSLIVKTGKYPTQRDLELIDSFLTIFKMKKIRSGGRLIEYRYFCNRQISVHIIISKNKDGITINTHLDIGIHEESQHTLLTSAFLVGLSQLFISACPQLKRKESLEKDSITLIDELERRRTIKNKIMRVVTTNYESIVLKLAKSSLKSPISESALLKEMTLIIGEYLNINNPYISSLLPEIIRIHFDDFIEKITSIRKNLSIRDEELKKKKIEIESFKWSKSNGTIPTAVKKFISKRTRFGNKTQTIRGGMLPKTLIKMGIVELTFSITEDDIIVNGYTSKDQNNLKIKRHSFACPYCSQSFGSKSERESHMKKVHKSEAKYTAMLSVTRMYLKTSSNDYSKLDKLRNTLKVYMEVYRPCNSCSKIIELRDYYKEHYNPDTIKALIQRWNNKKSWVLCQECEKEKNKIKKFLT